MSEVKVNKLSPRSGTTVTIGDSGDTINVAGNTTITTTDNSDTLKLVSTDADASRGPVLVLHRDSGSPADNDVVGELQFSADSDAASETNFALLIGTALDVSHGSESGELDIQTRLAGTGRSRIKMNSTETIINDDSVNLDFRVESDANANMFFVNAGNSRIGIGTSGPSADLDIVSSADATNFRIENTTHNTIMDIVATTANKNSLIRFSDNDGSPGVLDYDHNDNSMKFTTNGSERLRILSGGGITFNGDTATANALDDYEEGTWTPSFSGTSSSPSGVNYASRGGYYTKVGRLVHATAWLNLLNWSSAGSGGASINGLPFTASNATNYYASGSIGYTEAWDSDNAPKAVFVEQNTNYIRLKKANSSDARDNYSVNCSASAMDGDEDIMVTVIYNTD